MWILFATNTVDMTQQINKLIIVKPIYLEAEFSDHTHVGQIYPILAVSENFLENVILIVYLRLVIKYELNEIHHMLLLRDCNPSTGI